MSDSLITKKAIAAGLKELTRKKSFDKITIHDITESCGLNRQSFYYHFQDKFELVDWIFYNETIAIIIDDLNFINWNEKVKLMLERMKEEDYFYRDTLRSSSGDIFKEYIFKIAAELFYDIVDSIDMSHTYEESEKRFISEFYAFGIGGVINAWATSGMKETPEYIAGQLQNVSEGTKRYAASRVLEGGTSYSSGNV